MDKSGEPLHWSDFDLRPGPALRTHTEPGWAIGSAWSRKLADLDLWLVFDGSGWARIDGRAISLRPGVALLLRPGMEIRAGHDPGEGLVVDALHFELRSADEDAAPTAVLPPPVLAIPDLTLAAAVTRRIRERQLASAAPPSGVDGVVAGWTAALLRDLEAETRRRDGGASGTRLLHETLVVRAEARLRERPSEQPSVEALAAEAAMSPDHFTRVFKSITGRSPQAAAIEARIDRARHLLAVTPMSVSEIAAALGYRDVYFFSRQFKRVVGMTPTAFREGAS